MAGRAGRIKARTLRLCNPNSRQWSIYRLDLDAGQLPPRATVGEFTGKRGEFYGHEPWKSRMIWVRFVWLDISPKLRGWSKPSRTMAGKRGRSTGSAR